MPNYITKKASVVLKFFCIIVCVLFLLSDAKMIYLSFNGNGALGFCIGIINLTIVHCAFLGVFYYALRGYFAPYNIITIGSFLSCNASYYATMRQAVFDSQVLPLQSVLYLLPLLFWLLYLLTKVKNKVLQKEFLCSTVARYPYYVVAVLNLLSLPLIPKNQYFTCIITINYFILLALAVAQLHKNNHLFLTNRRI